MNFGATPIQTLLSLPHKRVSTCELMRTDTP
jgi:hypothetical protein